MRYKVAIRLAIDGDLRFISHHDTMRLFERALSRAQLPIRFSEGFNPRPKLSLPLPRAVGVASEADVLVVELEEPMEPDSFRDRLAQQMPPGISLTAAWPLDPGRTLQVERVTYAVSIPPESVSPVAEAVNRLLASPDWLVERRRAERGPSRRLDLRAHLLEASLERGVLQWTVAAGNSGSIRPVELLSAVGLDPAAFHHRVRRISVQWAGHPDASRTHQPVLMPD